RSWLSPPFVPQGPPRSRCLPRTWHHLRSTARQISSLSPREEFLTRRNGRGREAPPGFCRGAVAGQSLRWAEGLVHAEMAGICRCIEWRRCRSPRRWVTPAPLDVSVDSGGCNPPPPNRVGL